MQLACSLGRTVNVAAAKTAIKHPAAPLRPSWPKFFRSSPVRPRGDGEIFLQFHTCERQAHRSMVYSFSPQQVTIGRRRALLARMKYAWLGCLFLGSLLFAAPQDSDSNVNARYTVETVIVSGKGWTTNLRSETTNKISTGLLHQLTAIIGQKLNPRLFGHPGAEP